MNQLRKSEIKYLSGVGPKRAELLAKQLDIHSFYDLLYYFPFRYIDRSTIHHITDLQGDMPYIQLKGRFINFTPQGEGAKRRLNALFTDGTGTIECVWFNRVKQIQESYRTGIEYVIFGKPSLYKGVYSIVHPEVDVFSQAKLSGGLRGMYNLTETLRNRSFTNRTMQQLVDNLLATDAVSRIADPLPAEIIEKYHLMPLAEALKNIHRPADISTLQRAQFRLKYEELFYLQLNILRYSSARNAKLRGFVFSRVGHYFNTFYSEHLPFALTGAQKRVIKEIRSDMGSGRQMNRLLQGDVGSGKTLVALMCMLLALDNDYQAAIMAPTEILAAQHFETISHLVEPLGIKCALLTGSTRKKQRETIHSDLLDGSLQIIIGTHALLEDVVQFRNLGLVIIDEQHRFGVAQRARLWSKNTNPPHVLVMTATPIPRTLAMTVYGDLDVSVIDELPPGRKPVTTILRTEESRMQMYRFLGTQLAEGRQVYVVHPLIQENEKLDLHDLEQGYRTICETFPSYRVCYVHGKMKPAEKEHQMQLFVTNQAQIMVATTVIEVGVNVPNASVMVIENAERFGLSQLHQLRGRVGRGAAKSYCILMSKHQLAKETKHRLTVMTETNDGFVVAEEDMKLRGPGDMEGTQQSGIAFNLRISNLAQDGQIVQLARDDARQIIDIDPSLTSEKYASLGDHIHSIFAHDVDWSLIS
ncbi:MAG: ATP-dependent DNA helicase RecG [bacterium]|nr:ATP-dependent DNA helicase RecG [bacterium]MDD6026272.1 ATP-dependent DNA helicase RecG [bacterium]